MTDATPLIAEAFAGVSDDACYPHMDDSEDTGAYKSAVLHQEAPSSEPWIGASGDAALAVSVGEGCVVRLRGLPFNATMDDVREFANGYSIDEPDGVLVMMHGDRRGEAFIRFTDPFEAERFILERDRKNIRERYIEVYLSYPQDMASALEEEIESGSFTKNPIVRLRGLPFAATDDDILLFFNQCRDKVVNIKFVQDIQGRRTGDCFLELLDENAVTVAMTKNRLLMGTRYVEVTRTTAADREAVLHVASRRGRGGLPASVALQNDFSSLEAMMACGMFPPPMLNPLLFMPPMVPPLAGPDGLVTVQIGKEAAEQAAANKTAAMAMMQSAMLTGGLGAPLIPPLPAAQRSGGRKNRNHNSAQRDSVIEGEDVMDDAEETGAYSSAKAHRGEASAGGARPTGPKAPPPIVPPSPLIPPSPQRPQSRYIVRVRGLPFSATEETVAEFFHDVQVQPQGVHMVYNAHNKPTGEAFVEVETEMDVHRALEHNGGALGHRYIEVFKSGPSDMQRLGGGPGHREAPVPMPPFPPEMLFGGMLPFPGMLPPMFPPFGFPPPGGLPPNFFPPYTPPS